MRFVIRLKDGETMASLCREFGTSRKTGLERFAQAFHGGLVTRNSRDNYAETLGSYRNWPGNRLTKQAASHGQFR